LDRPTTTKHIPPRSLARAVVDLLSGGGATDAQVAAKLDGLAGTPIHSTLVSVWTSTSGDLVRFGDELEGWFDAEMARLSGLYKRLSRWVLAAAAIVVALLVNLDPIGLTKDLYRDPGRRADFVVVAESAAASDDPSAAARAGAGEPSAVPELAALYTACRAAAAPAPDPEPDVADAAAAVERVRNCVTDALGAQGHLGLLGDSVWAGDAFADSWRFSWDRGALHVVKIAAVAAAIFFGAPFWWDVLRRLMGIRKTVLTPET
jgi:hypothetical protein